MTQEKRKHVTSFSKCCRPFVPISETNRCTLRDHFIVETALREVVARVDFLAALDRSGERFIFCKLYADLLEHCHDKAGNGFSKRIIEDCVRFLRQRGILRAVVRKRFGFDCKGWIIASHDSLATTEDGYCILRAIGQPSCHPGASDVNKSASASVSASVGASVSASVGASVNFSEFSPVLRARNTLDGKELGSESAAENVRKTADNPMSPLNPLIPANPKVETTQDTEARETPFAPVLTVNSLSLSPDQNERDPVDTLLIAARALTATYGDAGTNLATYIAAHALNGNHRWPRSVSYYMVAAQNYRPESSRGDVVKDGTQGGIYDFMLENAPDRLRRAVERLGGDPEAILWELEQAA
jgi:hypothetical protein